MSDFKKVLVVVDPQRDFVDGALGSEQAQNAVPHMVRKISEFNGHILVTRDTHQDDYMLTSEGRALPIPHCIKDTDGWKIQPSVNKALMDAVDRGINVKFHNKSTFGSLKLDAAILSFGNVTSDTGDGLDICLIGLDTDICVLANALILKTQFPDSYIHVDAKATAGSTMVAKRAALMCMKSCQIGVDNWEE